MPNIQQLKKRQKCKKEGDYKNAKNKNRVFVRVVGSQIVGMTDAAESTFYK